MAKRMLAALGSFVSQGMIFKVSYESLTLPKSKGGLHLCHVLHRATALFVSTHIKMWRRTPTCLSSLLMRALAPSSLVAPVQLTAVPAPFFYLGHLFLEYSYLRHTLTRPRMSTARLVYSALQSRLPPNAIEHKHPRVRWTAVWRAVHDPMLTSDVQSSWYLTVNGKQICQTRLHKIHLAASPLCTACGVQDDDGHRLVCGEAGSVWLFVRQMLAFFTRTTPANITAEMLLFPDKDYFPRAKSHTVTWISGLAVHYLFGNVDKSVLDFWQYINERHCAVVTNPKYQQYFSNFLQSAFRDPPRSWLIHAGRS